MPGQLGKTDYDKALTLLRNSDHHRHTIGYRDCATCHFLRQIDGVTLEEAQAAGTTVEDYANGRTEKNAIRAERRQRSWKAADRYWDDPRIGMEGTTVRVTLDGIDADHLRRVLRPLKGFALSIADGLNEGQIEFELIEGDDQ